MTPIGIAIGWSITKIPDLIYAFCMSSVSGAFIYLASSSMMPNAFLDYRDRWKNFSVFLIALCLITLLWILENHIYQNDINNN